MNDVLDYCFISLNFLQVLFNIALVWLIWDSHSCFGENHFIGFCVCLPINVLATGVYLALRISPMEFQTLPSLGYTIISIIFTVLCLISMVISGILRHKENQIKRVCNYIENIIAKCSDTNHTIRISLSNKAYTVLNEWKELYKERELAVNIKIYQMLELTSNQLDTYFKLCEKDDSDNNIISFSAGMQCVTGIINLEKCVRAYLKQKKDQNDKEIAELLTSLASISKDQSGMTEDTISQLREM